jgi:hypothetical protein
MPSYANIRKGSKRSSNYKRIDHYELKRKNPITLGDDSNLEKDLKPFKIDGKNTILELSESELKVRGTIDVPTITTSSVTVDGESVLAGSLSIGQLSDVSYTLGNLELTDLDTIVANSLIIDVAADMEINVDGGQLRIKDDGVHQFLFDCDDTFFRIYDDTNNPNDYFTIQVGAEGATTISTVDQGTAVGHLTLDPDGDLLLQPATHTYSELPIGFTQDEPTFNATDTIVLFSTKGNKAKVTLTNNCTDIHFKFPAVSGNFICVLLQDGSGGRTITNWKTQDSAGNAGAGNSGLVLWAGGGRPSNTETADKADIASFYWDADNEIAYGTYTYNF